MKYFAQNLIWPMSDITNYYQVYEITSEYALTLYKGLSKAKQFKLVAVPNHKKGTLVYGKSFSIWGEIVTNAECFKRRLNGRLAKKVLNKRIADE